MGEYGVNGEFGRDYSTNINSFVGLHKFLHINNRVQ